LSATRAASRQGIQSVEVGGRLLEALAGSPGPMMLRDLAAAARMPPAQAHRYLVSFGRLRLVEQDVATGRYDLGGFALSLGLAALARIDAVSIAARSLPELSEEIGQTVALAVWANHGPTLVRWLGADAPGAASLRVGSVMSLTRSATGGAFVAFDARRELGQLLRRELAQNQRRGLRPRSEAAGARRRRADRRLGYAVRSDFIPGICGIAAPVYDRDSGMVLALVALGYDKPFRQDLPRIARVLLRQARALSTRLGYVAGAPD
jgi:DNA-binding IclR family transcriptional regulator